VYRREPVDELSHGLLRVRGFTQDDSHIFCRKDQVENEVYRVLNFAFDMLRCFGFDKEDYEVRICTRRKGTRIDVNSWRWAQKILADAAKQILGVGSLEWADRQSLFYGAQLDVEIKDRWRTRWVCSTIQLDLLLAEKFGLLYEESDGDHRSQPYIIHRTLLGSLERFYALLMEHHDGALPVWLAPIQAMVIPVAAEQHLGYATEVKDMLCRAGLRATVDSRNKGLGWKLRNHTAESYDKVPYLLVVGSQEMKQNTVSLRLRTRENLGERSLSDFIQLALSVDRSRSRSLLPDYDNAM
jgi:threonyl-tRNA synthetase